MNTNKPSIQLLWFSLSFNQLQARGLEVPFAPRVNTCGVC